MNIVIKVWESRAYILDLKPSENLTASGALDTRVEIVVFSRLKAKRTCGKIRFCSHFLESCSKKL